MYNDYDPYDDEEIYPTSSKETAFILFSIAFTGIVATIIGTLLYTVIQQL